MTADERLTIVRVYNNNALLARGDGTEVVAVGRGIGYGKRAGDLVDPQQLEQLFVPDGAYREQQIADAISDSPPEHVDLARRIVRLATESLGIEPRLSLLLPVLDHLTFAIRRAERGQRIDIPLRWEVEHLYPAEAAVGRRIVELVKTQLGVALQEDEAAAFALHLVNQQWARTDIARTLAMTETLPGIFTLLAEHWGRGVDERSRAAVRFVAHLRYLFVRIVEGIPSQDSRLDVRAAVTEAYPEAAAAALAVAERIGTVLGHELGSEEVAYLMLHVARLYEELDSDDIAH